MNGNQGKENSLSHFPEASLTSISELSYLTIYHGNALASPINRQPLNPMQNS